jgi:hypothetical protein
LAPPWGQNLYPKDNEIHNFGRGLPALHHHALSFSYIHVVSEKIFFFKNWSILTLFAPPQRPQEGRISEINNLCPLFPKMYHIEFEKNWSSGYQEEAKIVQISNVTIHHVWPHPGSKTSTPRILKLTILV